MAPLVPGAPHERIPNEPGGLRLQQHDRVGPGTIFTSELAPGRYTIFVESQDASGNWGVPTAIFLTVQ